MIRLILSSVLLMALVACDSEGTYSAPPAPSPAPPASPLTVALWGMVFPEGGSGACIHGATVEIVGGQRLGEKVTQEPCSHWDYGGGFSFTGLNPDRDMTLRASASGFAAQEKTFPVGLGSQRRIDFRLSRNQ